MSHPVDNQRKHSPSLSVPLPASLGSKCSQSCENAWEVLQKWHMTRYLELSSSYLPSWSHLGAILGYLGAIFGPILGPLAAILGQPWGHLGAILGSECSPTTKLSSSPLLHNPRPGGMREAVKSAAPEGEQGVMKPENQNLSNSDNF